MNIIPVIDLKNGHVVAAQQGQRASYQPINLQSCKSSLIEDVLDYFLKIYPFKNIYIADLNAITGYGNNDDIINRVIKKKSSVEFWLDNGLNPEEMTEITDANYRLILGSECQKTSVNYKTNKFLINYILSLDFFPASGYSGPQELLKKPSLWPKEIIIMTLDKVGSNQGPDFEKLVYYCQKYPDKDFIAAGGIRGEEDLIKLMEIGINSALVASALHSGVIDSKIIKELSTL